MSSTLYSFHYSRKHPEMISSHFIVKYKFWVTWYLWKFRKHSKAVGDAPRLDSKSVFRAHNFTDASEVLGVIGKQDIPTVNSGNLINISSKCGGTKRYLFPALYLLMDPLGWSGSSQDISYNTWSVEYFITE